MIKNIFISLALAMICNSLPAQTVGSKVSLYDPTGKTYTGVIKDIQGDKYKVKYDGFDFEAWLTTDQFRVLNGNTIDREINEQAINVRNNAGNNTGTEELHNIFEFGRAKTWASKIFANKLDQKIQGLSADEITGMVNLFHQAKTSSARFYALKSWLCGDRIAVLQTFIEQMNRYTEEQQQQICNVATSHSIIQQWQQTCSVTVVQTYLADLCPRYLWFLFQHEDYTVLDNSGKSASAQQQKMLLEKYGGIVSPRGDNSGKQIPINDALNEMVGKILGLHFSTQQVTTSIRSVFEKVRGELSRGLDVPLLVGFVGTDARHFILVLECRHEQAGYKYLIYDPWDGMCDYVNESTIEQGSFSPLFPGMRLSVDYYYTAD